MYVLSGRYYLDRRACSGERAQAAPTIHWLLLTLSPPRHDANSVDGGGCGKLFGSTCRDMRSANTAAAGRVGVHRFDPRQRRQQDLALVGVEERYGRGKKRSVTEYLATSTVLSSE